MGLVDGQAIYLALLQQQQRLRPEQCFRRQVKQLYSSLANAPGCLYVFRKAQGTVQENGRDTPLLQLVDLILHERDKGETTTVKPSNIKAGNW